MHTYKQQVDKLRKELARLNLQVRTTALDPKLDSIEWYHILLDAQATDARLRFLLETYKELETSARRPA